MPDAAETAGEAVRYATMLLARRDHAEAELAAKLGRKGFSDEAIGTALQKLRGWGYLDDNRFARSRAEAAIRSGRGFGRKIAADLQAKGVDRNLTAEVMQEISAAYPEAQVLRAVAGKKFPRFDAAAADEKERRRVAGYLLRRGFSTAAVFSYLRTTTED